MSKVTNPRQLAVLTLSSLEATEDFLREVLDLHLRENDLSSLDQGLYTELVYGTVRMQKNLDYVLSLFSKRPLHKLKPNVLNTLRVGAYQTLYLDRVPDSAAVNEAVKLARLFEHQGVANFTNAILRQVVKNQKQIAYPPFEARPVEHLSLRYSFPEWVIEQWIGQWGFEETEALCLAMNQPPELHVRTNTLRITQEKLTDYLEQQGVHVESGRYAPEVLRVKPANKVLQDSALSQGLYYIQDESSVLAGHALQVQSGQQVYDLCSAPGGKTTHLAQLMEDRGGILAFDVNSARLAVVEENARRLGISIITTKTGDATQPLGLKPAPRVLVDAPCSGLGTMRHRPDIRWRKNLHELEQLQNIQRKILDTASNYVQSGGFLVYSTCTLTEQENQEVARWFLASRNNFVSQPLPSWFPQNREEPDWYRTFLPHRHHLDGFFVAVFRKL